MLAAESEGDKNERGALSAARVFLALALLFTAFVIVRDSGPWDVPGPAYVLLGTICTGLLAWAGGARIAQYVGPPMGAVASGIAAAVKSPRSTYQRPAHIATDESSDFEPEGDEP